MTEQTQAVTGILGSVNAVIVGDHFVYTSGLHGDTYINKDAVYPYTEKVSRLCHMIAQHFVDDDIDVVVAPAVGAVILSQWVAHHLSSMTGRTVLGVYADKNGDAFSLKRGYDKLVAGQRVLVIEDIINTGKSVRATIAETRSKNGNVIAVAALCNRGPETAASLRVPLLYSLLEVTFETHEPSSCPYCEQQVPVNTQLGKGAEFLAQMQRNE